jgi:D-aminoacyl-tRNA deacylase
MRMVIQRVKSAKVSVEHTTIGAIDQGWLVLLGIEKTDTPNEIDYLVEKLLNLRLFSDEHGKFNLSITDIKGALLIVSQFTLMADCSKGRRPSFINSAGPEVAEPIYLQFVEKCKSYSLKVETGKFGANMQVELVNDGPVTIVLDSSR